MLLTALSVGKRSETDAGAASTLSLPLSNLTHFSRCGSVHLVSANASMKTMIPSSAEEGSYEEGPPVPPYDPLHSEKVHRYNNVEKRRNQPDTRQSHISIMAFRASHST